MLDKQHELAILISWWFIHLCHCWSVWEGLHQDQTNESEKAENTSQKQPKTDDLELHTHTQHRGRLAGVLVNDSVGQVVMVTEMVQVSPW